MVWWYAIFEGLDTENYEVVDFDGGYYLTFAYVDGDDTEHDKRITRHLSTSEALKCSSLMYGRITILWGIL